MPIETNEKMVYKIPISPVIFMVGSLGQGDCASSSALINLKNYPHYGVELSGQRFKTRTVRPTRKTRNREDS